MSKPSKLIAGRRDGHSAGAAAKEVRDVPPVGYRRLLDCKATGIIKAAPQPAEEESLATSAAPPRQVLRRSGVIPADWIVEAAVAITTPFREFVCFHRSGQVWVGPIDDAPTLAAWKLVRADSARQGNRRDSLAIVEVLTVCVTARHAWVLCTNGECRKVSFAAPSHEPAVAPPQQSVHITPAEARAARLEEHGGSLCIVLPAKLYVVLPTCTTTLLAIDIADSATGLAIVAPDGRDDLYVSYYDRDRRECVELHVSGSDTNTSMAPRRVCTMDFREQRLDARLIPDTPLQATGAVVAGLASHGLFVMIRKNEPLYNDRPALLMFSLNPVHPAPLRAGIDRLKPKVALLSPGSWPDLSQTTRVVFAVHQDGPAVLLGQQPTPITIVAEVSADSVRWSRLAWSELGATKRQDATPLAVGASLGHDLYAAVAPLHDKVQVGTVMIEVFARRSHGGGFNASFMSASSVGSLTSEPKRSSNGPGLVHRVMAFFRRAPDEEPDAAATGFATGKRLSPPVSNARLLTPANTARDNSVLAADGSPVDKLAKPFGAIVCRFSHERVAGLQAVPPSLDDAAGLLMRLRLVVWYRREVYLLEVPEQLRCADFADR
jgi:hypothetical protein